MMKWVRVPRVFSTCSARRQYMLYYAIRGMHGMDYGDGKAAYLNLFTGSLFNPGFTLRPILVEQSGT